ncbi:lysine--tRNA ligase [Candidatus Parcubacteria bacterium]|nr:lysine--tRNA ligase [Candidatus Parcubacteria bacterium]
MPGQNITEKKERLKKLNNIKAAGINPYPSKFETTHTNIKAINSFDDLKSRDIKDICQNPSNKIKLAGRLMTWRKHGKIIFSQISDFSGQIQISFLFNVLGEEKFNFLKNFDIGDIIGVEGELFKTKRGEITLLVVSYTMLSKSLKPLPEKWHGIKDDEIKFRKRYLDIIFNPDVKEMLIRKAKFWDAVRNFLNRHNFLEVETPILEITPSGADAEPFKTHINALDMDVYLRISTGELWQKRLMVAGFEKTFEIGRQFRNEGISPEHLQDYTQMECYWAFADYKQMMRLMEKMYQEIIKKIYSATKIKIKNEIIDFSGEWPEINYAEEIYKQTKIDIFNTNEKQIKEKLEELKVEYNKKGGKGRLIDSLWKYCRKSISGPAFLLNHPVEISPLAKRSEKNLNTVDRFQILIAGSEIGNGYSELNDPIDQNERFNEQAKLREQGDLEAQMRDKEFVEALEHGMPPTAGFGVSERLFWFLENKPARECVTFPLLRPKN